MPWLFCFILLPSTFNLRAQSYAIDWFTIDGGGGGMSSQNSSRNGSTPISTRSPTIGTGR